jgi:RNA ligase (TIGR02306 family)
MKRKLASIQKISNIEQIKGADRIVAVTVMGWCVVVKKGEFEIGDLCVFFEIDSILPETEWSEFMRPRKFRVKTCKLRGTLSQGLVLPLYILGEDVNYSIGDDVTEALRVKKFDIEKVSRDKYGFKTGSSAGLFPSFIPKTDEIRIQSAMHLLDVIKDLPFYYTVKCDGTSSTFYRLDDKFVACSRNRMVKQDTNNVYWEMVDKYKLEDKINNGIAIQGEICGPGIQKNKLALSSRELFIFDIFDIKSGLYFGFDEIESYCKEFELPTVPIEGVVRDSHNSNFDHSLEAWVIRAKGKYVNTNTNREGLVIRSITEDNRRISFKVMNNNYLLKEEE